MRWRCTQPEPIASLRLPDSQPVTRVPQLLILILQEWQTCAKQDHGVQCAALNDSEMVCS
jgi:hypothetical protein